MKNRMTLRDIAGLVFNLLKPKSFVEFLACPWFAPDAQGYFDTVQENADSAKSEPPAKPTFTMKPVQTESPAGPVVPASNPAALSSRLKTGCLHPADLKKIPKPYSRSTTNLISRKANSILMMIAASFIMQNQPILNHTLEKQKEAMDKFIGDSLDKTIESYSMCRDCTRRSRACQDCKFHNSQRSIKEIEETALFWENMTLIKNPQHPQNPKMKVVMVHYPLDSRCSS